MSKPIELNKLQSQRWMKYLLRKAEAIGLLGEVPVSAIVLNRFGHCIGHGSNRRERDNDPLVHAEFIALKQASLIKNDWRFNDCTLIVTLEPCPMCAGALVQARMGQVIYGASDFKRGALGGVLNLSKNKSAHHHMIIQSGILEIEVRRQLEIWFKQRRQN